MKLLKLVINLFLAFLLIWFLAAHEQKIRAAVASRDSIQYWASGNLLAHRQNPYSVEDIEALERSQGYAQNQPLILLWPPWAMWLVLPSGLLNAYFAWIVWLAILLVSLVIAMRLIWRMYGDGARPPAIFLVAGYLFAPVLACLVAGQLGLLLLLGVTVFLAFEKEHPFLAGAALILPMAKPHIFAPVWPILALWILARRKWSLFGGIVTAFVLATAVGLALDPAIFHHYEQMLHQQGVQNKFIPALSGMIRAILFRRFFWVQFVPLELALVWTAWYYWKNREEWNWRNEGVAVLVVAVLTTPYAWMTDEVVLLPAILQGVLWLQRAKLKLGSQLAVLLFICLDLLLLLIVKAQVPPGTGIYFWSSLVWFSWYWFARSFRNKRSGSPVPQPTTQEGS